MTDDTRWAVSVTLFVVGLGWWLGVDVYRGFSQDHSARMFWLHLTAPVVAIVLVVVAIVLLAGMRKFDRLRGRDPVPATESSEISLRHRVDPRH